jgi:hypothetical protein
MKVVIKELGYLLSILYIDRFGGIFKTMSFLSHRHIKTRRCINTVLIRSETSKHKRIEPNILYWEKQT